MSIKTEFQFRKAVITDAENIRKIINIHAANDEMLPRSLNQVYETIRDFWVCVEGGRIVGCCALHIFWADLAELRSMAVEASHHGRGIGKELVRLVLNEARQLGIPRVFLLTYKPDYFSKFRFRVIDKQILPHKVWTDCINCPKFPDCGEVAMIQEMQAEESLLESARENRVSP